MSVNSSSFPYNLTNLCVGSRAGLFLSIAFITTRTVLLLPLFNLVLHLGYQRWQQQRSFATTSHADIFTYHMTVIEIISNLGQILYFCGTYMELPEVMMGVGFFLFYVAFNGQLLFHILTCLDRYLAVIHPFTYLRLRQSGGVKIRNITTVGVWLFCICSSCATVLGHDSFMNFFLCMLSISFTIVSFCSLCILCVLIRPGPGEVGGDRERVDKSKQRAFHTIIAITGVLGLWFIGFILCMTLIKLQLVAYSVMCVLIPAAQWFSLPSSLVLPLLFLHRTGKLSSLLKKLRTEHDMR